MSNKIRLYPEHKSLYFMVEIYKNRKQMIKAIKEEMSVSVPKDTEAYVECFNHLKMKDKKLKLSKILGKIYFYENHFGVNTTVSHEMIHASNGYFANGVASNLEERFCYCVGAIVGDFYNKRGWK